MKKIIFSILLLVLFSELAMTANRFNVWTHADNPFIEELDSFYIELDDFGVSHFYTTNTHSIDSFQTLNLDISVILAPWGNGDYYQGYTQLYFDSAKTVWSSQGYTWSVLTSIGMNSINENNPEEGYTRAVGGIGDQIQDDVIFGRTVSRAVENIDDPGYLFPGLGQSVFHHMPKSLVPGSSVTLEAYIRLLDSTGVDTTVVAQLIFENTSDTVCELTSTDKYAAINIDDTIMVVGSSTGWDTVATIDRIYNDTIAVLPVYTTYCYTDWYNHKFFITHNDLSNVCYIDEFGDTVCVIPFRKIKNIRLSDFRDSTGAITTESYTKINMEKYVQGGFSGYDYELYWTGEKTLYLDTIKIYDERGTTLDSLLANNYSEALDRVEYWYNTKHNLTGKVDYLASFDEPIGPEFQTFEKFDRFFDNLDANLKGQVSILGSYSGFSTSPKGKYFYDTYINYSQEDFFIHDIYYNLCANTSSSEGDETSNSSFQKAVSVYTTSFEIAKERSYEMNLENGFWTLLPTFASTRCTNYIIVYDTTSTSPLVVDTLTSCDEWTKSNRLHTSNEMKMLTNLSLMYGAKGIGYWLYMGHGGVEYTLTNKSNVLENEDAKYYIETTGDEETDSKFPGIIMSSSSSEACSTYTVEPYMFKGLVTIENNKAEKTPLWDSLQLINKYLDSMAYIFNNTTSLGIGTDEEVLSSKSGSFIDSIKSLASYNKAYLQVGFLEDDSVNYAMILNKRVDDGTYGQIDSQTVSIFMNGEGVYELWDIYNNTCDTLWDSSGTITHHIFLEPGEGKLIKKSTIKDSWSGTVDPASWLWDWQNIPINSTINIIGDITIDSGQTFIINPTNKINIKIAPFSDATSSGSDTSKTEIIVYGELRIEGTSTEKLVLAPEATANQSWRGIRVNSPSASYSGKLYMEHVNIKGAYEGVRFSTGSMGDTLRVDSILYCKFDSCFMRGVFLDKKNSYLYQNSFLNTLNGYGLYIYGSTKIDSTTKILDCTFDNVKYPIYSYWASPIISACDFNFTESATGIGYGQPAIWLQRDSDAKIYSCDINNYKTGIKVDFLSDIEVELTSFDADSFYIPVWDDTTDLMEIALDGVGLSSSCKVRNSCFRLSDLRYVNKDNTSFDLGTSTDLGDNTFYVETRDGGLENHPEFAIESWATSTLYALGNYWEVDTSVWFFTNGTGIIDADSAETSPNILYCANQIGEFKVDVNIVTNDLLPQEFSVSQNYPNPFNPETQILFTLPNTSHVKIEIFNIMGQLVKVLLDKSLEVGNHTVQWNSNDATGNKVSSGVYLYRIEAGENLVTKKMILLK